MRVILFGATGMVGQGVLRELLRAADVEQVLAVVRTSTGQSHPKLQERKRANFSDFSTLKDELSGYDACFYCLGVSSAGMSEKEYRRVTHDYALAAAEALLPHNPELTFVYVSGAGTDSSESARVMWARVKGETENALLRHGFKGAFMFRPAYIHPMNGEHSKTVMYRTLYAMMGWVYPAARRVLPGHVTTTEEIGLAMLHVVREGAAAPILESADISWLARQSLVASTQPRNTGA